MLTNIARKPLLIIIAAVVIVIGIQMIGKITPVQATDDARNMRTLLEGLKQQIGNGDFSITFEFNAPLLKGDYTWWSIPEIDQAAELKRNIGEIGDDYVCFVEQWGQNFDTVTRCTPFSNIAAIAYLPQ